MNDQTAERFVDHPTPSAVVLVLMVAAGVAFVAGIAAVLCSPPEGASPWFVPAVAGGLSLLASILGIGFWLRNRSREASFALGTALAEYRQAAGGGPRLADDRAGSQDQRRVGQ